MHLIMGTWAAELLSEELGAESVWAFRDPLSVGPVTGSLGDLDTWLRERATFWQEVLEEEAAPVEHADLVRVLDAPEITVWVGVGTDDQLLAAWLCSRVAANRAGSSLRLVQLESTRGRSGEPRIVTSIGHLGRDALLEHPEPKAIPPSHAELLRALWSAWIASEPTALMELGASNNGVVGAVAKALLDRYPDSVHGLGRWDLALLRNIGEHGPKVVRPIGHTLGESFDSLDNVGDGWLLHRIHRLGAGPEPLLQVHATSPAMRDTSATLTDAGRAVLAGTSPAYELRVIDDWVGGVHLSTAQGRLWLRTEAGLARWSG